MRSGTSSRVVLIAAAALVVAAAWVRVHRLRGIDLFCDEALATEIASSLWRHGELNPFRFSRFLPESMFRDEVFFYFPPLSYFAAAPFGELRDSLGANIAPRLPALLSGLVLIGLLIPAARTIFADTRVGLAAAALTACNGFHIGMSRMALPYALLPPLLVLSLLALLRALRRDRLVDWIGAALSLTASAYVSQVALLFWAIVVPCALATRRRHATLRRLVVCFAASAAAFLVWVAVLPRAAFFANSFFATTADYRLAGQLAKIAAPYAQMLAPWPLALVFTVGLGRLVFETVRRRDIAKILLLVWLLLPWAIVLTRSMWILDYHLYFVYPPVILVAGYGVHAPLLAIDAVSGARWRTGRSRDVVFACAVAVLCWLEWRFAPPAQSRAAHEFGSPQILSRAAAHIRRHDRGEAVIAPIGTAEAYYLERFVRTKNRDGAVAECLELVSRAPAWVFMGDNYFHNGRLDECDEFVREHGTLVLHSAPIASFTDAANPLGYALYYLDAPERRP